MDDDLADDVTNPIKINVHVEDQADLMMHLVTRDSVC